MIPQPNSSFSVIALENINSVWFREEVNHVLSSDSPRIAKDTSEISTEGCHYYLTGPIRTISDSPCPNGFILDEIKGVKESESLDKVSEIDWEAIFEQVIRTFFKRNSAKS